MKRLLIWFFLLAALGGGGAGLYWYLQSKKGPEIRYETAKVDRGSIVAKVTATGTVSALVTVQVGTQVSGRIQKIYVDFNSPVKKGQRVAQIDPALFKAAVEQGRANVLAAEGSLAQAKAQSYNAQLQFQRSKVLAKRDLIAKADLDTAEANAKSAVAQVDAAVGALEQARAQLHQAQINLNYTHIISPTNGVVISRNVDVGQTVAASLQAPVLFLIAEDLKKMQVDTNVAEADVGKLRPQMPVSFTVDAYPSEQFKGVVRQIRNAPQTLQNVVTYDAVIDVANPDLKLRPGMTANVTFVYAERDKVLRIPNGALRFRPPPEKGKKPKAAPDGGAPKPAPAPAMRVASLRVPERASSRKAQDRRTVWVLEGISLRRVRVRTGITDGKLTELLDGPLRDGDLLVTDVLSKGKGGPRPGMRF
jgi:HlyD family secretion protein